MSEINLGQGSNLIVTTARNVTMREHLTVVFEGKAITLDVKIEADFDSIPEAYHEIFLNVMTSKYYSKVSFGDNPFSQCVPVKTRRWWQLWK
jgi:hypothetical protein